MKWFLCLTNPQILQSQSILPMPYLLEYIEGNKNAFMCVAIYLELRTHITWIPNSYSGERWIIFFSGAFIFV